MQRMIPVDKLARPEDHILLPANRTRNARSEQGLSPGNAMPYEDDFLKSRMHGICGGEFQAMEAAGRTLYDFPDAPWEFQLDMARQVWDESRHAEIYMKLLEYVGSYYGEFPEGEVLWSCTQAEDPAARVAGINRGLEGLACDVFEQLIRIAQKMGDTIIERSVDYVLADEITHVRMGSQWMRKLTEGDPERFKRAQEFQDGSTSCSTSAPAASTSKTSAISSSASTTRKSKSTRVSRSRARRVCWPASPKRRSSASSKASARAPHTDGNCIDMEKCIPVDRLARPDNWVVLRSRQVREIREEQGLEGGRPMPFDEETLRSRLHGIYTGELQAMEAAGRTLFDFPDAPWEFQLDMARQVWDEARHSEIFQRLVEYMGGHPGDYVETEILWRCTQAMDPAARVAGINRGLEGLACDVFDQLIRIAQRNGDEVIERSVDYVLADEITHVRMGSKWMRKLTEGDPERLAKAQAFQDMVDEVFNFRGGRLAQEDIENDDGQVVSIAKEARMLAGFTEEEIQRLINSARKSAAY